MIKTTCCLIAVVCGFAAHSQWLQLFGEDLFTSHFYEVIECSDGNLAMSGMHLQPGMSTYQGRLTKTNSEGELIWEQTYFPDVYCEITDVKQANDGGFFFCGGVYGVDGPQFDAVVARTDAEGNILWSEFIFAEFHNRLYSLVIAPDGGVLATGILRDNESDPEQLWLYKISEDGDEQWSVTYPDEDARLGVDMKSTEGGVIITGSTWNELEQHDVLVTKIDWLGNQIWINTAGGSSSDYGSCVYINPDGTIIVGGALGAEEGEDMMVKKLSANGDDVWTQTFDLSLNDGVHDLLQTSAGHYFVIGAQGPNSYNTAIWMATLDTNGALESEQTLSAEYELRGISAVETEDEGIVVAGLKRYEHPQGGTFTHAMLFKGDNQGNTVPLNVVEEPLAAGQKQLLQMVNLLGQKIENPNPGELVIYQYSDGSTEKKVILP